jgi:3-hydroxymyristoyl/3-hydroxydecanoyl-(acyl carrier protein) dehydratase
MIPPTLSARFEITADHPCLAGHFPGRPVTPAVVLMERVVDALQAAVAPLQLEAVAAAKFIRAVMPGETVEVRFEAIGAPLNYAFSCSVDATPVATGRLRLRMPQ